MKKKTIAILVALMLLGGCSVQTPAPADVPPAESQDLDAIIQQSVDEALREKMAEYEKEQQKKDQEIADLKKQLEELTVPPEVPPEETPASPASQPEEPPAAPVNRRKHPPSRKFLPSRNRNQLHPPPAHPPTTPTI